MLMQFRSSKRGIKIKNNNFLQIKRLIKESAESGADLVALPEYSNVMVQGRKALLKQTYFEENDPTLAACAVLARELQLFILLGSLVLRTSITDHNGFEKLANRSFLLNPDGLIQASYTKIHLFDANIDGINVYQESKAPFLAL